MLRSRPVRVLAHPLTALALFTVILVGWHLTPLYNLALEQEWLHELEHVAFFVTALLFWWPAIGVDPAPHRLSHPGRLLYLLLDMPVMAYLGLAIASSSRVLYPYYAAHPPPWGASPLQDQGVAGTIMWIAGTFTMIPAMAVVFLRWLDDDARKQARREARPVPGTGQAPGTGPADGEPHRGHRAGHGAGFHLPFGRAMTSAGPLAGRGHGGGALPGIPGGPGPASPRVPPQMASCPPGPVPGDAARCVWSAARCWRSPCPGSSNCC